MSRDDQFADAAKLLTKKLFADPLPARGWREAGETQQLIAEFLSKFASHVASFVTVREIHMMHAGILSSHQVVDQVPDMAEWTEE